jgi:hypothetical protein
MFNIAESMKKIKDKQNKDILKELLMFAKDYNREGIITYEFNLITQNFNWYCYQDKICKDNMPNNNFIVLMSIRTPLIHNLHDLFSNEELYEYEEWLNDQLPEIFIKHFGKMSAFQEVKNNSLLKQFLTTKYGEKEFETMFEKLNMDTSDSIITEYYIIEQELEDKALDMLGLEKEYMTLSEAEYHTGISKENIVNKCKTNEIKAIDKCGTWFIQRKSLKESLLSNQLLD